MYKEIAKDYKIENQSYNSENLLCKEQLTLFNYMNEEKLKNYKYPKVNYIGNKKKLTNWICDLFPKNVTTILDAFSGGCSVSFEAKKRGYKVLSNDILKVNFHLSKAIIENNSEQISEQDINIIFSGKPFKGYVYKNYSNKFFFENECMELDLYRKNVEKLIEPHKKSLALSLLRRAMIRKMPYSRFNLNWETIKKLRDEEYNYKMYKRKRAYHNKSFKEHFIENINDYNKCIFNNSMDNKSYNQDIFELLDNIDADVVYLDPPYTGTMNDYFGFYSFLDTFIDSKYSKPFSNNFKDKQNVIDLFNRLFSKLTRFKYWYLSYNNSAYPNKEDMIYLLSKYAKNIEVVEKKHIYKITGKENKEKNKEYLFIVKNF